MTAIHLKPEQLGPTLRAVGRAHARTVKAATYPAAHRLRAHVVEKIDKAGVTDRGIYKNSAHVERDPRGAVLMFDAPHSGVIEGGARPHKVSAEGRASIKQWAIRKLGLTETEAEAASFAICKKIEREGQKGTFIVRDSMGEARRFYAEEVVRLMQRVRP